MTDPDRILRRMDLFNVLGTRSVLDVADYVVIFVDHLHRAEALADIGYRDRHRPGVEIEHPEE